jgi:hypothetical protein
MLGMLFQPAMQSLFKKPRFWNLAFPQKYALISMGIFAAITGVLVWLFPLYLKQAISPVVVTTQLHSKLTQSAEQSVSIYFLALQNDQYNTAFKVLSPVADLKKRGYPLFVESVHNDNTVLGPITEANLDPTKESTDDQVYMVLTRDQKDQYLLVTVIQEQGEWHITNITYY